MEVTNEMREFLKARGSAKTAKEVGVSAAYISQCLKKGKISETVGSKITELMKG